jgi:hypothetical protein
VQIKTKAVFKAMAIVRAAERSSESKNRPVSIHNDFGGFEEKKFAHVLIGVYLGSSVANKKGRLRSPAFHTGVGADQLYRAASKALR